ncbi:hypothetical protein I6N98_13950 [Spongiibacter nanhainus]|uniref:Antitoxin Xre/MbcA/ParS-like toxin-binding domain-containing protein n=1 Tax=Spongiibacter nanhainus TaxID=2794344 RepID=A0A7T4QZD1_9GAMM|nr:hypothetical protein [Spongiibacter nanhainus]QQD17457.1 hypothetical protein I6N98_13950 [Spongiibacter nanhainus]
MVSDQKSNSHSSPVSDEAVCNTATVAGNDSSIAVFTLGEMRMAGLDVPVPFTNEPDDRLLTVSIPIAERLAARILDSWAAPQDEVKQLLGALSRDELRYVLLIDQLTRVLSLQPESYLFQDNTYLDGQTPWSLIADGNAKRVHAYLAHQVFSGGW